MLAIGGGFAIFLVETRLGSRSVRIGSNILGHEADEEGDKAVRPERSAEP